MGNIKQKERINKESNTDDDIYCVQLVKSRTQELEDRRRQKDFASIADIKDFTDKRGYNLIRSEEHPPSGDMQITTSEELKKERAFYNKKSGNSYRIH